MLAEERIAKIIAIIEDEGSVTVQRLMDELGASESTVRRDLVNMDAKGLVTKVHGGAVLKSNKINTKDEAVNNRKNLNLKEKVRIAKFAANLISDDDFVYIDAGTTTELLIDYLSCKSAIFVTNSISAAKKLSDLGFRVYILGGEFKSTTEAIVGEEAVVSLDKYNFTKGFWGTNGVNEKNGLTTPEIKEAMVKKKSMENCKDRYVLADASKLGKISSVKFAEIDDVTILTSKITDSSLQKFKNIQEV